MFLILKGMGMSINSAAMCGDYIFSGHTLNAVVLTLTFLEYTPSTWLLIHWLYKLLCLSVMVLLIYAHDHYTVDVILAWFITYQSFSFYHAYADNSNLRTNNKRKKYPWNTFVSFLEENIYNSIPNEYQLPDFLNTLTLNSSKLAANKNGRNGRGNYTKLRENIV